MFFLFKESKISFPLNLESLIGIIFFRMKNKKKNHYRDSYYSWKSKIFSCLKISDIGRIHSDIGFQKKEKKLYSRTWNEFNILLEIIFLTREFGFSLKITPFHLLTFPFLKSRFNYFGQATPGSSKNLLIFLSLIVFIWERSVKIKWSSRKKDQVLITLESSESEKQILNFVKKPSIFIGIFNNNYFQKNFRSLGKSLNQVVTSKTSSFFRFKNSDLFLKKKFKLIIIDVSFSYVDFPIFSENLRSFFKIDWNSNQKLIFTGAKKFSFFFSDLNLFLKFNNRFFFSEKYEMCGNSYIKLSKFLETLPFFTHSLFVFTHTYNMSNFLSKLIPFFYKKQLKRYPEIKMFEKETPVFDKKKISILSFFKELSLIIKPPQQLVFFDIPFKENISPMEIRIKKKKNLNVSKIFFFKKSEKKLFATNIQELLDKTKIKRPPVGFEK